MSISKLFRLKEKPTVDGLVARYQEVQTQKAELTEREASLKKSALYSSDTKGLGAELAETRLQLELCETAEQEIIQKLRELITSELEKDYKTLPEAQANYDKAFGEVLKAVGQIMAQAVGLLTSTGRAPLGTISSTIQRAVAGLSMSEKYDQYAPLVEAFHQTPPPAQAAVDFSAERRRLKSLEDCAPGSKTAKNRVNGRIMHLLDLRDPERPWLKRKPVEEAAA